MNANFQHVWRRSPVFGLLLLLLGAALLAPAARATSILETTLPEAFAASEFVFEGIATESEVRRRAASAVPETCVAFRILDVIAGTPAGGSITLCFLGGFDGKTVMQVDEVQIPPVGEHGIYFVHSRAGTAVNPLFGWAQGHFIVERDPVSGVDKVLTAHKDAVLAIRPAPLLQQGPRRFAHGVAADIVTGSVLDLADALPVDAFKSYIRALPRN